MTDTPSFARSPRERHPEAVASAHEIAATLVKRRRSPEAGWLLLGMVAAELQRKPPIAPGACGLARAAAAALRNGGQASIATEIEAAARDGRLGQVGDFPGRGLLAAGTLRSGLLGALDAMVSELDGGTILGWYALFGLHADGARLAERLQRHADAGRLWKAAGRPLEAARAYATLGDDAAALTALVSLLPTHRLYRPACVALARMALRTERLDFEIDNFLGDFLADAPRDAREADALAQLATLYGLYGRSDDQRNLLRQARGTAQPRSGPAQSLPFLADFPPLPELPVLPSLSSLAGAPPTLSPRAGNQTLTPIVATSSPVPHPAQANRPPVPATPTLPATARPKRAAARLPIAGRDEFVPGAMVGGRYRLEATLGQGAMGAVFRATDFELGEQVAIKVMSAPANNERWLQRFRQELKLTRRLAHPNIVRVYDIGVHENARYITMELLEGADLRNYQARRVARQTAIALVEQAAAGLAAAHAQGVVHRDVKPENLFVTQGGTVKVMDFGIARGRDDGGINETGLIAGTASYMAPEQATDFASAGPAADLYGLGIVAYELFCGRPPFRHADVHALLHLHATAQPPPPSTYEPSIPAAVELELLRAIEKRPEARHAGCVAFAEALREAQAEFDIAGQ